MFHFRCSEKCPSLTLPKNENIWKYQKIYVKRKMAKRQPICMLKPAYNFLNHTFNSFNSTGQKMLQTCPSLAKLLPNCDCLNFWWAGFKSIECCSELCLDNGSFWCLNCFCNTLISTPQVVDMTNISSWFDSIEN